MGEGFFVCLCGVSIFCVFQMVDGRRGKSHLVLLLALFWAAERVTGREKEERKKRERIERENRARHGWCVAWRGMHGRQIGRKLACGLSIYG